MITPELISYVRSRAAKGTPRDVITNTLLERGWQKEDVAEAFGTLGAKISQAAPRPTKRPSNHEPHNGRKLALSLGLIATSGLYTAWALAMHEIDQQKKQAPIVLTPDTVTPIKTSTTPVEQAPPTPAQTTSSANAPASQPTTTPAPKPPTSVYADGVFTGNPADAYYGTVQIKIAMHSDKITDVAFLQYPNSHGTSIEINSQAMPLLKQEALSAQSANVRIISGATDTSIAFRESLASALANAKN